MKKHIRQNHSRYDKRGQWAKFYNYFSKKRAWRSFSNRYEWTTIQGAAPIFIHQITGFPAAQGNRQAPANAVGYIRMVLTVEVNISDFLKSIRCLTEHKTI